MKTQTPLRTRILAATSVEEIEALLREGQTYQDANDITKRRWQTAASRRAHELRSAAQ